MKKLIFCSLILSLIFSMLSGLTLRSREELKFDTDPDVDISENKDNMYLTDEEEW